MADDMITKEFKSICPFFIGFMLEEGGAFKLYGCRDEESAQFIMDDFLYTGEFHMGLGEVVKPFSMYKFESTLYRVRLPREGNE